jgi:hypothetical protein
VDYVVDGLYSMVISDPTENWSEEVLQSGPGDSDTKARNAALWNVEDRAGVPLAPFSTNFLPVVNFSNCTANGQPISNGPRILYIYIRNFFTFVYPSIPLGARGTAFSVLDL